MVMSRVPPMGLAWHVIYFINRFDIENVIILVRVLVGSTVQVHWVAAMVVGIVVLGVIVLGRVLLVHLLLLFLHLDLLLLHEHLLLLVRLLQGLDLELFF